VTLQEREAGSPGVAVIEGVEAGSVLQGLSFHCLDEIGRPAEAGTAGKVQVSWSRGSKKLQLKESPLALPDIQASYDFVS
jgi:hypothetical protein